MTDSVREAVEPQPHVSGHGGGSQIKAVIDGANAKKACTETHTEKEEYHKKWHDRVVSAEANGSVIIS